MKTKPTATRCGLLAGGNWTIEYVKCIDAYPHPGSQTRMPSHFETCAGNAGNLLFSLSQSRAPFPLSAAGLLGTDVAGEQILTQCRKLKIETRHVGRTSKAATAFTDAMTEAVAGRRTLFHSHGANALWTGDDLDFTRHRAKLFHLGSLMLLDALDKPDDKFGTQAAKLLAAAQAAGVKTSVDAAFALGDRFPGTVQAALKFTDYLILSETRASQLTGFRVREPGGRLDTVTLRHAAGALLQQGIRELVVLHFPEGAFARSRKGEDVWQPSIDLPPKLITGRAGVGDAFRAGFLFGLHEGWETRRCLEAAVCVAAACLTDPTPTGGIKGLASSLALGKKYRFHPPLEPAEL
jgi:sugar/nucleoside kinase (ribokinase family)